MPDSQMVSPMMRHPRPTGRHSLHQGGGSGGGGGQTSGGGSSESMLSPVVVIARSQNQKQQQQQQQQQRRSSAGHPTRFRDATSTGQGGKAKKPLSAGFKNIVWTSPPPVGYTSSSFTAASPTTRTTTSTSRPRESPAVAAPPAAAPAATTISMTESHAPSPVSKGTMDTEKPHRHQAFHRGGNGLVEPDVLVVTEEEQQQQQRRARDHSDPHTKPRRSPRKAQQQQPQQQVADEVRKTGEEIQVPRATSSNDNDQSRLLGVGDPKAGTQRQQQQRQQPQQSIPAIPAARSEDFGRRFASSPSYGGRRTTASGHLPGQSAARHLTVAGRALDVLQEGAAAEALDSSTSNSAPMPITRPTTTTIMGQTAGGDGNGNVIVVERSLSDSSVMTATSDFSTAAPGSNAPVILTAMSDEDALAALQSLLAKGKGLSVVKHATGLGSSKSRKLLKYNEAGRYLALSGVLPPYFKTKIPVQDVDRVDAKWCCVVLHAKGRSPIRLEVDSFATADMLRAGLMAASRMTPTPSLPNDSARVPPPPPTAPEEEERAQQRGGKDVEQGLASVRPGHSLSQVYDPDAALSVAALLAKEMEEERLMCSAEPRGGMWAATQVPSRTPEVTPPVEDSRGSTQPVPTIKRSASMNSVVSSRMGDQPVVVDPITNRLSLPRGYGGPMLVPGASKREELVVVDAKASLRRLYDAIEGSGMAAIKRNAHGKGGSRVMVRSKIKEKSIGWVHVLPPFSRKFVAVSALDGAHRVSRVVTVNFTNREPVMFETDKLTDALILEQGFVALTTLHTHNGFRA